MHNQGLKYFSLKNILVTAVISFSTAVFAAPSAQVAGYYHQKLGDYRVTALLDGTNYLKPALFKVAEQRKILQKYAAVNDKGVQTSVNAFAIQNAKTLTLLDSGASQCVAPHLGSVLKNLTAAGYEAGQVNAIVLTHLHPDHICGISLAGQALYPNATVYVPQAEADFWLNPNTVNALPEAKRAGFLATVDKIKTALAPYIQAKRYQTFTDGAVIQGLTVLNSAGHTPGHRSYALNSQGQQMVFIGDIVHSHSLQFDAPTTSVDFDSDAKQAVATRLKMFKALSASQVWVAAPHLPFPGIGHISQINSQQYQWIPVHFNDQ